MVVVIIILIDIFVRRFLLDHHNHWSRRDHLFPFHCAASSLPLASLFRLLLGTFTLLVLLITKLVLRHRTASATTAHLLLFLLFQMA